MRRKKWNNLQSANQRNRSCRLNKINEFTIICIPRDVDAGEEFLSNNKDIIGETRTIQYFKRISNLSNVKIMHELRWTSNEKIERRTNENGSIHFKCLFNSFFHLLFLLFLYAVREFPSISKIRQNGNRNVQQKVQLSLLLLLYNGRCHSVLFFIFFHFLFVQIFTKFSDLAMVKKHWSFRIHNTRATNTNWHVI